MKQKDITERVLESYNDVFADIVNNLLFNGKNVVKEDELKDDDSRSQYKIGKMLHEQERDVAKFWINHNIRLAFFGLENQTAQDKNMPLRIIGYDGAVYRSQLLKEEQSKSKKKTKEADENQDDASLSETNKSALQKSKFPVITMVLYFGKDHWTAPKSLYELLEIPDELKEFVSDYKINVFEISYLTKEQVEGFTSDFKFVADYFVQTRINDNYVAPQGQLDHVHEFLQLISVLTQDYEFEKSANEYAKGEKVAVGKVVERFIEQGRQQGMMIGLEQGNQQGFERGMLQGINDTRFSNAKIMLSDNQLPYEQIARYSELSLEEVMELAKELGKS